ncbi:response regulator [Desulfolutivibrio sulfoxidireducens]|uniref:response regulator n=1 Tax=Desulfolutivibrio sulfoxidireducens TaxID=2773299 RepID=UPI00159E05B7|nr:response regulator [Desulfolutivibrio sulfoxidireducens]QLA17614.1 response regulator [Desulfolutivibrio sulfoxidireducens]QLA21190.1 response regulator [Desulfolutivibrio sulfoxidireducens]
MKILVVEDDATSREVLFSILSEIGPCDVAADGEEALRVFGAAMDTGQPYDLVCLDILLPRMDGQEVLRRIRGLEAQASEGLGGLGGVETKVVMISALSDPKNVVEAFYRGGATAYVPKPIDRDHLFQVLGKLGVGA